MSWICLQREMSTVALGNTASLQVQNEGCFRSSVNSGLVHLVGTMGNTVAKREIKSWQVWKRPQFGLDSIGKEELDRKMSQNFVLQVLFGC